MTTAWQQPAVLVEYGPRVTSGAQNDSGCVQRFAFKPPQVRQHSPGGAGRPDPAHLPGLTRPYLGSIATDFTFQISSAYCRMVRSLENLPERAVLSTAMRVQFS